MTESNPLWHGGVQAGVVALLIAGWLAFAGLGQEAWGQDGPSLRSIERPVRVVVSPEYQWYESELENALREASTDLRMVVPVGTRWTVEMGGAVARMGGNGLARVQGLTDANARITYAQPVGEGSVVFSGRVNVPVGKQRLGPEAVRTTRFISRNIYDFPVTSFSRGFSVNPQVTWAFPVTDRLAVGIGAGYQHQRGFYPEAGMESAYVPGDGMGLNGGFDYKVTDRSAVGLDLAFRRYQTDEVGGAPRFEAGNRATGTVRYLWRRGFTTVRAVVQYANWEESEFGYRANGVPQRNQIIPSHGQALVSYQARLAETVGIHVRASGHRYSATLGREETIVGRAYVSPSFDLGERVTLAPHGTITYGSYLGGGGGLRIEGAF